jgi:hypothetical protein
MIKPIAYFVIGLFAGLIVSELMKDAKPVEKIVIYDGYRIRYDYPHYYRGGYDYYYRPLEYRGGVRTQSNTRNDGERRGGGTKQTGTTTVKDAPERKKSWGTKY